LHNIVALFMASPDAGGGGGSLVGMLWIVPLFLIMYLLLIRPQRKQQKEHQKLLTELKKGDRVVTNSGMYATIFAINDDKNIVVLKLNDDIKVEFMKSSIAARVDS